MMTAMCGACRMGGGATRTRRDRSPRCEAARKISQETIASQTEEKNSSTGCTKNTLRPESAGA
jgi:hypothetical protein